MGMGKRVERKRSVAHSVYFSRLGPTDSLRKGRGQGGGEGCPAVGNVLQLAFPPSCL